MNDQQLITPLKDDMLAAIQRKDVAGAIGAFADQTVMFLRNPPLRFKTGDSSPGAGGIEERFASFEGPIHLTYQELEITASDAVAFCHSLDHLSGKRPSQATLANVLLGCI